MDWKLLETVVSHFIRFSVRHFLFWFDLDLDLDSGNCSVRGEGYESIDF